MNKLLLDTNIYIDYYKFDKFAAYFEKTSENTVYVSANDVLIALSARRIGATVITQNRKDFEAIQSVKDFKLKIVSQLSALMRS